jgi:hypothetical protein
MLAIWVKGNAFARLSGSQLLYGTGGRVSKCPSHPEPDFALQHKTINQSAKD